MRQLTCFKSYDIRGKLGEELNDDIAYDIGAAIAQSLEVESVVLGGDCRETSASLKAAVARGLQDMGGRCPRHRYVRHRGSVLCH